MISFQKKHVLHFFLRKMSIQFKTLIITRKASDLSIYPPINLDHNKHHEITLRWSFYVSVTSLIKIIILGLFPKMRKKI